MGLTPEKGTWQQRFITQLCKTGNISDACRKAKVSRTLAYEYKAIDKTFASAWDESLEIATEALELEARRRAATGVLEPIYHQGVAVGTVRKYSDTLLIFLLKAHKPEKYRDNVNLSGKLQTENVGLTDTERLAGLVALANAVRAKATGLPADGSEEAATVAGDSTS